MRKTEKYQLNQWELSDRIRMEDFNADNARLETALDGVQNGLTQVQSTLEGAGGRFRLVKKYVDTYNLAVLGGSFGSHPDWSRWDRGIAFQDMGTTKFPEGASLIFRFTTWDGKTSGAFTLKPGPLVIVLYPFHSMESPVRGLLAGTGGCYPVFLDITFAQLSGYGISVSGSTGTTSTGPVMYFYAAE